MITYYVLTVQMVSTKHILTAIVIVVYMLAVSVPPHQTVLTVFLGDTTLLVIVNISAQVNALPVPAPTIVLNVKLESMDQLVGRIAYHSARMALVIKNLALVLPDVLLSSTLIQSKNAENVNQDVAAA